MSESSRQSFETPFEDVVAKYAMTFAQPVFFGDSPAHAYAARLFNGTASLLLLGDRYLAITCAHVLNGFRAQRASESRTVFHIGRQNLDPERFVISESTTLDLAVFDVTTLVAEGGLLEPSNFSVASQWPPGDVSEKDILAFAGFPGVWREQLALGYLRFYAVTVGTADVASVSEKSLMTRLDLAESVSVIREGLVLGSIGGLSGGPVFAWRSGPVLRAELVGFAVEYQETFDLLCVRRATCLDANGILLG